MKDDFALAAPIAEIDVEGRHFVAAPFGDDARKDRFDHEVGQAAHGEWQARGRRARQVDDFDLEAIHYGQRFL